MLKQILSTHLLFPLSSCFKMSETFLFHLLFVIIFLEVVVGFCFMRMSPQPLLGCAMLRTF